MVLDMKLKRLWAIKVRLLLIMLATGCAGPALKHSITFEGIVMVDGNGPLPYGDVIIVEMIPRPFMMPGVRRTIIAPVDKSGYYRLAVDDIRGMIDISFDGVRCQWRGDLGDNFSERGNILDKEYLKDNLFVETNFTTEPIDASRLPGCRAMPENQQ